MCSTDASSPDTPIYNGILSEVLAAARREVDDARRAAARSTTVLHASVAQAMEAQSARRAAQITAELERTASTLREQLSEQNARLAAVLQLHREHDGRCLTCRSAAPCATADLARGQFVVQPPRQPAPQDAAAQQ